MIEDWLRRAYAGEDAGCPPPEVWLAEELAALSPEQRAALERHAAECPACGAERELARAWDAGTTGVAADDLAAITARLSDEPERASSAAKVIPFRRRLAPTVLRVAAAAALLIAAGLAVYTLRSPAPPLPPVPLGSVLRGGEVELLVPLGELAQPPAELRWRAVDGAAGYRVRILAIDDSSLWETRVTAPTAAVPTVIAQRLHPAVSYRWTVEALAPTGAVTARSPAARFRIAPPPEH